MKLSVVTVCCNNLDGLRLTRESVDRQTWRDFEWIVIDGKSDDGTADFLANLDPQPGYWVSEKDNGAYDAMNKGLARAKGEYVLFLNSGDALSSPESLEKLMLPESSADIIYGDLNFVGDCSSNRTVYPSELDQESLILQGLPHPASAIRTQLLKGEGGYDTSYRILADFKFFLQAFRNGCTFLHRPHVISDYALGGVSYRNPSKTEPERYRAIGEVFGVAYAPSDYDASKVAVVVPVCKERPSPAEALALKRSLTVLKDYQVALCCPDGLDASGYDSLAGVELRKERFAACYFNGIDGCSRLTASPEFYLRFSDFEYLLVCPPDAWIFRDELRKWCARGYDYVGAPLFGRCRSHEVGERLEGTCGGGLSLRRVDRFVETTQGGAPHNLKTPMPLEAAHFAFERSPRYLLRLTGGRLPFGCHAWAKYDFYGFWSRYIPYRLSAEEIGSALEVKDAELKEAAQRLRALQAAIVRSPSWNVRFALKWLTGQIKQFFPYGAMCVWLRCRYNIVVERPHPRHGFGRKSVRRLAKFILPYGMVMKRREMTFPDDNAMQGRSNCREWAQGLRVALKDVETGESHEV